jgi:CSLREA domain-containing protein
LYSYFKQIRLLLVLALSIALCIPVTPARAASFTVNSNGDQGDASPGNGVCATAGGTCTLRAAIDETNALSGPNTINIPAMTIILASDLRISNHVGDDSVIINGAGQQSTIIDGANQTRAFNFAVLTGNHTISNLKIQNCRNQYPAYPERDGGGIYNGAGLTLTNVTITNSRAFQGGGVYNQYAGSGNVPVLNLNNVTLTNNSSTGAEVGVGGGGLFNGSILNANGVTISNNSAASLGGGYYNNSYQMATLSNFVIQDNTAREGGGIMNDLGNINLQNGTISGNTAVCCRLADGGPTGGGGIYNNFGNYYNHINVINITNISLTNNRATSLGGYAGGIINMQIMDLTNVTLANNQAHYGAGIYNGNYEGVDNQLDLANVTISGNIGPAATSLDSEGAGIFNINNGHITILNSTITRNTGEAGSGITNRTVNTSITIKNTILAENTDVYGAPDCRGTITSLNYNLIGNPVGTPALRCTINLQSSDITNISPLLNPLEGNPAYHPLQSGSAAVNGGTNAGCPSADIRGVSRPQGPLCDIGAYELQFNIPIKTVYSVVIIRSR